MIEAPHKPLLALYAIGRALRCKARMASYAQAGKDRLRERQRNRRIPRMGYRLPRRSDPPAAKPELLPRKVGRRLARQRGVPGSGKIQSSRLTGDGPQVCALIKSN
jgi:hypothetical protein